MALSSWLLAQRKRILMMMVSRRSEEWWLRWRKKSLCALEVKLLFYPSVDRLTLLDM